MIAPREVSMPNPGREFLHRILHAALLAVDPARLVKRALHAGREGLSFACGGTRAAAPWGRTANIFLVGGGKAARRMGEAALGVIGARVSAGALSVPKGSGGSAGPVRFIEAGHPLPDRGSLAAAQEILSLLSRAREDDLVIALISGGGSAMICAPAEGISFEAKVALSKLLLGAGADIASFNTVRGHLSRIKGGRAARAAYPARTWALLLSDVPRDDPAMIASGPFSPDPTTCGDALRSLSRLGIFQEVPGNVIRNLEGAAGGETETLKAGDPVFEAVTCAVVGSNRCALDAAAAAARKGGLGPIRLLPGFLSGDASRCAKAFVAEMRNLSSSLAPRATAALIVGGETTVRVRGTGKGGRCQEFALSAAIEISGANGMAVLAAGTDGIDGPTDAAGATADGSTCDRAREIGLSPALFLERNDAYSFFRALGDLVVTGPTGTNVADIAIGLVSAT